MPGSLHIQEARTVRDLRAIILFPWQLYRDDPFWVPPIVSDRLARFDPQTGKLATLFDAQVYKRYRMFQLEL